MFVCLWTPPPASRLSPLAHDELVPRLLTVAPRVTIGAKGVVWADARGLNAELLAKDLIAVVRDHNIEKIRAVISSVPIAAEVAALYGNGGLITIPVGSEREFLA